MKGTTFQWKLISNFINEDYQEVDINSPSILVLTDEVNRY